MPAAGNQRRSRRRQAEWRRQPLRPGEEETAIAAQAGGGRWLKKKGLTQAAQPLKAQWTNRE